jgi:hypothetical protein
MFRIRTARPVVALVVAVLSLGFGTIALEAPAQAWPYKAPVVKSTGHVRFTHSHAFVRATYRCYGGNQNTHVWVSVKQGPKITAMSLKQLKKAEGTSRIARSWYDTNTTDPQRVYVVCDGTWQHQTFRLSREKGRLHHGRAFVQFCLFDSHADPTGQDLSKGFAFKYTKPVIRHR